MAFAAAMTASSVVAANEVLVNVVEGGKARNVQVVAIDLANGGDVAGFSFHLVMPGLDAKQVDLSACVSELPKGFSGKCQLNKDGVSFVGMADSSAVSLPAGVAPIGRISFQNQGKALREMQVVDVAVGNQAAQSQQASAKVIREESSK
jgi:hypothetical protein